MSVTADDFTQTRLELMKTAIEVINDLEASLVIGKAGNAIVYPSIPRSTIDLASQFGVQIVNGSLPTEQTIHDFLEAWRQSIYGEIEGMISEVVSDTLRQGMMDIALSAAESAAYAAEGWAKSAEEAFQEARAAVDRGEPGATDRLVEAANTSTYARTAADEAARALADAQSAYDRGDSAALVDALNRAEAARDDALRYANETWNLAEGIDSTDGTSPTDGTGGTVTDGGGTEVPPLRRGRSAHDQELAGVELQQDRTV
jgi:hypothetical protein